MKRRPLSLAATGALTAGLLVALTPAAAPAAAACPWVGSAASPAAKASQVLGQMTLEEKLSMTHGSASVPGYAGSIAAIPRLCIPSLRLNDGGAGVVMGGATAMPAPIAAAATWDTDAQHDYGQVVGAEAKAKGVDVNLGPNVNLVRDPRGGRAFETVGEDPFLAGAAGTAYVEGVQSQGVMADLKHLVANDVEQNRNNADSVVDERTLNEIYYPPFKQAVQEGDAASIMAATSLLNGVHSNENATLLKDTAKQDWGFEGFVVTDWDSARSTVRAANAQLDLNMPAPGNFGQPLSDAVRNGEVSVAVLNDKITRILAQEFQYGLFENQTGSPSADATSAAHTRTAQDIAAESTVLMKNDADLLPLDPSGSQSIVVIGEAAEVAPITGGGGSSHVPVSSDRISTIVDGIADRVGAAGQVDYAGPWHIDAFATAGAQDVAANMLDGRPDTRWTSGTPQAPGQSIVVDTGTVQPIDQVSMDSTTSTGDYARGYQVFLSTDGSTWGSAVASGPGTAQLITASFATTAARYVKIVQTGSTSSWWSIAELNVSHSDGAGGQVALSRGSLVHVPGTTEKLPTVPTAVLTSVDGKPGLTAEYFNNLDLSGAPALTQVEPTIDAHYTQAPGPGVNPAGFSVRWSGFLTAPVTGTYTFSMANTGGIRMQLGGRPVFDDWAQYGPGTSAIRLVGGVQTPISVENYQPINSATGPVAGTPTSPPTNGSVTLGWQQPDLDAIAAAAAAATHDVAVVVVNDDEMEDGDRQNLTLPGAQDDLVAAVAAANPNTVVVLNTGAPVLMPWLGSVPAVLESWYGGQTNGAALASVLFGDVNPSGKLPQTWPTSMDQMPTADSSQYPGVVDVSTNTTTLHYSEGLEVGYRWYDAHDVTPLFPFGFGLSYSSFGFSDVAVGAAGANGNRTVTATVTNTGTTSGSEIAQLYLGYPAAAGEPPRTLKGFERVTLAPQASTQVSFTLTPADLQVWDSTTHHWSTTPGDYRVHVGSSSRDLPLTAGFTLGTTAGSRGAVASAPALLTPTTGNIVTTTLPAGGTQTLQDVALGLDVPEGWTATAQGASTFATVAPTDIVKTTWRVTPPADAQTRIFRVAATATADGGYRTSNGLQVTVGSIVTGTLTSAATMIRPGTPVAATLDLHNGGDVAATVTYRLTGADAVTVTPATGTVTVPADGSVDVPLTVAVGATTATSAAVDAALQVTIGGNEVPTNGATLDLPVLFDALAQAYGNVGVGNHANPGNADFDGAGFSYSQQGLAAAGVVPGQPIVHGDTTYTWPNVAAGAPDNVVAAGQRIAVGQKAKAISILGSASNGSGSGTGSVTYTDGTTAPFTLALTNWTPSTLLPENELVATSHEWNPKPGSGYSDALDVSLYSTTIPLDPTRKAAYLTLPASSTGDQAGNRLHLFDLRVTPADPEASTTTAVLTPPVVKVGMTTTATIEVTGAGNTPTGTVTVTEGTTELASAPLSDGAASMTLGADLPVGTHELTVSYPGDDNYAASSTTVTLTVETGTPPATITPATPRVVGTATVGRTVQAAAGTWRPTGVRLTYQWLRDGAAITGARGASYRLVGADGGHRLSVRVTGTVGTQTASRTSATVPVLRTLTRTPKPKITGTPAVGSRLAVRTGPWAPAPVNLTVVWLRDGKRVATGLRYTVRRADRHHRITVVVTGRRSGYEPVAKTSAARRVR